MHQYTQQIYVGAVDKAFTTETQEVTEKRNDYIKVDLFEPVYYIPIVKLNQTSQPLSSRQIPCFITGTLKFNNNPQRKFAIFR